MQRVDSPLLTIWWHQLGLLMLTEEESGYISITHLRWGGGVGNLMLSITFQQGGQHRLTSQKANESLFVCKNNTGTEFVYFNKFALKWDSEGPTRHESAESPSHFCLVHFSGSD